MKLSTSTLILMLLGYFLISPCNAHAVLAVPFPQQIATNPAAMAQLRAEQLQQTVLRQNAYLRGVSDERGREVAYLEDLIYYSTAVLVATGLYLFFRTGLYKGLRKHISSLGELPLEEKPGSDSPPKPSGFIPKAM